MKAFAWGVAAGYLLGVLLPHHQLLGLGKWGRSPGSDRPPGMTGGGPGWLNNPGL